MRRGLPKRGTWSITPLGVLLLGVLVAAAILCAVGSRSAQDVAFVVLAVDLLMLANSGLPRNVGFGHAAS